jgi:predicted site-specific integrase-resolvase
MNKELFTREEVARILQVVPKTVWKWQHQGRLKAERFEHGKPLFTIEELEKFVTNEDSARVI